MPIGVEHRAQAEVLEGRTMVSDPVMPIGVEHIRSFARINRPAVEVSDPVMPIGVEHMLRFWLKV